MAYGLTLEQVRQTNRPAPHQKHWGSITSLTEMAEYAMYRIDIAAGGAQQLHFFGSAYQAYVEAGEIVVRSLDKLGRCHAGRSNAGNVLALPKFLVHAFSSTQGAVVYLFGERRADPLEAFYAETEDAAMAAATALKASELPHLDNPTTDVREKYWGRIETIMSEDVAAKRIFVQKGGRGSLEFHVEKRETYYIHSGLVKVGLRIGRAENHSIVMSPGESYDVRPGVMHLREGLEDTVIIEVSTRDSDSDSYLVEDGQTYRHIDAVQKTTTNEKQEQPA
jgi:mannose-6-phosphate isomerase-like protein (cupin superfamily)